MKHCLSIWLQFVKISIIRELEFTYNFLLQTLGHLLWFVFTIIFFEVLYTHIDSINGWLKSQTIFLVATNQIIIYLYETVFARNLSRFPELIRSGYLDHLLLKPLDIQFFSSVRYFNVKPLFLLPIPLFLLVNSLSQMNTFPSTIQITYFLFFIICGVALRYLLGFSIMMLSFLFVEISALYWIQNEFLRYASYPASIFKRFYQLFFTFIVPVILIANLPASIFLRSLKDIVTLSIFTVLYIVVFFGIVRMLFNYCLKYYCSASN